MYYDLSCLEKVHNMAIIDKQKIQNKRKLRKK